MKNIILDTNFLLIPAQFKVDIFSEIQRIMHEDYKLCVVQGTIDELNDIVDKQGGKNRDAAKLALALVKANDVEIIESTEYVDTTLAKLSEDAIIATQDKELKKRLKGKIIILRQKKYLEIK